MIKLHLRYLCSKFNLLTITIIILLYAIGLIVNVCSIPDSAAILVAREMYFYNTIIMIKLIIIILVVFLMAMAAIANNDSYQLYILSKRVDRIKYYFTKILALFLLTIVIIGLFALLYILFGLLLTSWYKIEIIHIKFFLFLMLISYMYGLMAYNLVKFLNSLLAMFIPCVLVIFEEVFMGEKLMKWISYLFPVLNNSINPTLSYGVFHVIAVILCYLLIGLIKAYTIDIK